MSNNKDFKVKNGIQPTAYHEGLGTVTSGSVTVGYDLSVAAYDSVLLDLGTTTGDTVPRKVVFKSDGTRAFYLGAAAVDIYQIDFSTAWDLSTASYSSVKYDVNNAASMGTDLPSMHVKPDGTKFYVLSDTNNAVYQFSMSTAWDLSTSSYDSVSFSVNSQSTTPEALTFSSDGTKMYVGNGSSTEYVYQYNLSTAWDLSTASYSSNSLDLTSETVEIQDLAFSSSGDKLFAAHRGNTVIEVSLSTAWDISTATATGTTFSIASQDADMRTIAFKSDGTKMYVAGQDTNDLFQYSTGGTTTTNTLDLSTGSVFEITPTSNIQVGLSNPADSGTVSQATLLLDGAVTSGYDLSVAAYDSVSFSIASQDTTPSDITFKSDGTKMYLLGDGTDNVYQYSLSTAWDLSTATYDSVSFSVSSQDGNPYGIDFKPDGTKMYVLGLATDYVYQYSLSTAWDVSTASYDSVSFSVASQDGFAYSFILNDDGNSFYILGTANDTIYQYSMSTAYDLSTTSYASKSFSVTSQDSTPSGISFNNDGTLLYMCGRTNDSIYQYSLTTAYDISTASYDSVSFSFASQDTSPFDIFFKPDGAKLYMLGYGTDTIYQYTTGAAATITYDSTLQWGGGTAPDSPAANETDVLTFSTRDGGTTYQAAIAIDGAA